ncbi:quinone-dependent dihydroorotate dehydrogenase [soil metagenome]
MDLYDSILKPVAFCFDPEFVHERALGLLQRGMISAPVFAEPRLEQTFWGRKFANPLGLAAGFDKNGVALNHWHKLGFGFVEAGTVTFHAQPGNPKPRMFRVPEDRGLINRLGFNNHGSASLAETISRSSPKIPLGINLGKSKITELADAPGDYRKSFEFLHLMGDYFVINVSSPNTPGLRSLQEKGPLLDILSAMRSVDDSRPIFIKVAPDLEWAALDEVIQVAVEGKATGLIATNTTISREGLSLDPQQAGGLSGAPLKARADAVLIHLYKHCPEDMMLIGVGGIMSGKDLFDKISYGAHLCQVYTGWIYGGPHFAPTILRELVGLMEIGGFASLADLRGARVL